MYLQRIHIAKTLSGSLNRRRLPIGQMYGSFSMQSPVYRANMRSSPNLNMRSRSSRIVLPVSQAERGKQA